MAEAEPVEQSPERRAMGGSAPLAEFDAKLVQGQIAVLLHALTHPVMVIGKLPAAARATQVG